MPTNTSDSRTLILALLDDELQEANLNINHILAEFFNVTLAFCHTESISQITPYTFAFIDVQYRINITISSCIVNINIDQIGSITQQNGYWTTDIDEHALSLFMDYCDI